MSSAEDTAERSSALIGALRWDNWRLDSSAGQVILDPPLRGRIPYFVWRDSIGKLALPGDFEVVLHADVEYARAAGIDYFIFGYYLETGSWGRSTSNAKALNSAYRSYIRLRDHAGVRFALNFDYGFPAADVGAVSEVIADAARQRDYVHAADGSIPVFFFAPDMDLWVKGLGGEENARKALTEIKRQVFQRTGANLFPVALVFGIDQAGPTAERLGFDAVSTYANALGGGGVAVAYRTCADVARRFWQKGRKLPLGFIPTVTMGWDYRPILKQPQDPPHRDPDPSWCTPATDAEWIAQIQDAVMEAQSNPKNRRFESVLLYAWNEFSEGGWIAPTIGDGTRRLKVISDALGRKVSRSRVELTWPVRLTPDRCNNTLNEQKSIRQSEADCREMPDPVVIDWPCPPGLAMAADRRRSPSNSEASLWPGLWNLRVCD
jgi:hypothetical protein